MKPERERRNREDKPSDEERVRRAEEQLLEEGKACGWWSCDKLDDFDQYGRELFKGIVARVIKAYNEPSIQEKPLSGRTAPKEKTLYPVPSK